MKFANFGERLKKALDYRKMKQKELAGKIKVADSTITRYIKNIREPSLEVIENISRILEINPCWLIISDSPMITNETVKIPILSSLPSSFNDSSDFIHEKVIEYPISLLEHSDYNKRYVALKITEKSMLPELLPGDYVLIDIFLELKNGDIGAFYLNNSFTVKRLYNKENNIILKPTNPKYLPKEYTKRELEEIGYHQIGKVVKIIERNL